MDNYNSYRMPQMDDLAHVPALIAEIPNQNPLVDLYAVAIPDQLLLSKTVKQGMRRTLNA